MEPNERMLTNFLALMILVVGAVTLFSSLRSLSRRYAGDVRTVWYVFSLAFVISLLLFLWGMSHGAFHQGRFVGTNGARLEMLLNEVENLELSLMILGVAATILLAPQVLSYASAGLTGCAGRFWFASAAFPFIVWGVVKYFAVAGGVSVTIAVADLCFGVSLGRSGTGVPFALFDLAVAFGLLVFYRWIERLAQVIADRCPPQLRQLAAQVHRWASRNAT